MRQAKSLKRAIKTLKKNKYAEAQYKLEKIAKQGTKIGAVYYYLSKIETFFGNHERALELAKQAQEVQPGINKIFQQFQQLQKENKKNVYEFDIAQKAKLAKQIGNIDRAIQLFEQLLQSKHNKSLAE
eukprot:69483_1